MIAGSSLAPMSWWFPASAAQLRISWFDNAVDEQGISVERRADSEPGFSEVAVLAADATSYLDAGVVEGSTYCYRARAFNRSGFSAYSEVACAQAKAGQIVAAVLPGSRSVQLGGTGTAFGTIVNPGADAALSCGIAAGSAGWVALTYQTTDPLTNAPVGSADVPVDIPAGQAQTYVLSLTPMQAMAPTDLALEFVCSNKGSAPSIQGLNTLVLSASTVPVADVVAVPATLGGNGIMDISPATATGVFAIASSNVGAASPVVVTADTGTSGLALALSMCETNAATGVCLQAPADAVEVTYPAGAQRSFAVFAQASGAIQFDPAVNRVFVRFRDAEGAIRGGASVAVR